MKTKKKKCIIETIQKRPKREKILVGIAIATIILTIILQVTLFGSKYHCFRANWGITIPRELKEIVSVEGKKNQYNSYNTYNVLEYKNEAKVDNIVSWSQIDGGTIQYDSIKDATEEWLNNLDIKEEDRPSFEDLDYYYNNDEKSNEIIMLKDDKNKRIYIIEFFM